MKRSRRALSIGVVIHKGTFENNQITLPFSPSHLKQGLVFITVRGEIEKKEKERIEREGRKERGRERGKGE